MKILVTGGAGFIGSNLVDALIKEKHKVVIVDDLSTGFEKNINPQAKFYLADIADAKMMKRIFELEKPEIINHHAAQIDVRKSVEEPIFDAQVNVIGSINLIQQAVAHKVRKFIYISTGGAIYGEPQFLPVTEDHPINPECNYGITKHTVEHYLYLYNLLYGIKYTTLRYPNVYGPRQNPLGEAGVNAIFIHQMLSGITPTIFGDGEQLRDYVFIEDIVQANILALDKGDNSAYNIGTGIGTSVNQIYRELQKIIGFQHEPKYAPPRQGEIYKIYLNADKARRELDWNPRVSFAEGLMHTVEWHKREF
jgi:UDP-glucose 4-epimerase